MSILSMKSRRSFKHTMYILAKAELLELNAANSAHYVDVTQINV